MLTIRVHSDMRKAIIVSTALTLAGCQTLPENTFKVSQEQLNRRQIETRRYDGIKADQLLVASSNVLQDLGYSLDNSETKLGVLTASKQRDATEAAEVVGAVLVALLGGGAMAISKDQTIKVSLVVRPVQETNDTKPVDNYFVRITFQRIVRRTDNSVYAQTLDDTDLYVGFHEKLSKSVFLEANKI